MMPPRESGQLVMVRIEEARWSAALDRLVREVAPGGILFDGPLPHSPDETAELLRRFVQVLPRPPLLALRVEGGAQNPLEQFFPRLPPPRVTAAKGPAAVERLGELIGEALSLLGFNTNFAPILDLATPFTEKTLGARAFGPDPQTVAECGEAFLRGLDAHQILACGKHFPGWGSVPDSGAKGLPVSGKPMAGLWREDLLPYRQLLPRLPMVLMSSASYKAYDFDRPRPACLSPLVVEGLLRTKLGYRGVVLAYDFESKEVRGDSDLGDAAVQSLLAGCDMMILNAMVAPEAVRAVENAAASGKLPSQRLEVALARVRRTREKLHPPRSRISSKALDALTRRVESFCREFRPEDLESA